MKPAPYSIGVALTLAATCAPSAMAEAPAPTESRPYVVLYEHSNFRGPYVIVYPDEDVANLKTKAMNDRVSSLQVYVPRGQRLVLYEHLRDGKSVALRPGYSEYSDLRRVDLNDKISSLYWE